MQNIHELKYSWQTGQEAPSEAQKMIELRQHYAELKRSRKRSATSSTTS